jgi:hypothetical protein
MQLTSSDFKNNSAMPSWCGYYQGNKALKLEIKQPNPKAVSLAILLYDPDAPSGNFTHWIAWNIPPNTQNLVSDKLTAPAMQGTNGAGSLGYFGPAPPSGTHHYHFVLFALDNTLNLETSDRRDEFDQAIKGHVLEQAELVGLYTHTD